MESQLSPLLLCQNCRRVGLTWQAEQWICPDCHHSVVRRDGIWEFATKAELPLPSLYRDPDYRRWIEHQAESKAYFYQGSALIAWIQGAGHRMVRAMRRHHHGGLVLDLGCGDGHHQAYTYADDQWFGLDLDRASLLQARVNHPEAVLLHADATRLPFADRTVPTVISVYALEHLLHLDFTLEEVARILTREGDFYVSVPTEGSSAWNGGRRLTSSRHFRAMGFDYLRAQAIDHIQCIWQIDKTLRRHFRVRRRRFFPFLLPWFHPNLVVVYHLQGL